LFDYDTKILVGGNLDLERFVPACRHIESERLALLQSTILQAGPGDDSRAGPREERQKQAGAEVEPARFCPANVRTFDHDR
jgi:hypothetical protein